MAKAVSKYDADLFAWIANNAGYGRRCLFWVHHKQPVEDRVLLKQRLNEEGWNVTIFEGGENGKQMMSLWRNSVCVVGNYWREVDLRCPF